MFTLSAQNKQYAHNHRHQHQHRRHHRSTLENNITLFVRNRKMQWAQRTQWKAVTWHAAIANTENNRRHKQQGQQQKWWKKAPEVKLTTRLLRWFDALHISVDAYTHTHTVATSCGKKATKAKELKWVDSVTVFVCCFHHRCCCCRCRRCRCRRRLFNNLSVWIFLCFWFLLSHVALFVSSCVYVISLFYFLCVIFFLLLVLILLLYFCFLSLAR